MADRGGMATALRAHRAGDAAQAEKLYRALVDLDPPSSEAAWNLGILLRHQGRHEEGAALYRALRDRAPGDGRVRFQLAEMLVALGRGREAFAEYVAAIRALPDDPLLRINFARLLLSLRMATQALEASRAALRLVPDDPVAWFNLGLALERSGDEPGADRANARALRILPTYLRAVYSRLRRATQTGAIGLAHDLARQVCRMLEAGTWDTERDWRIFGNLNYLGLFGLFDAATETRLAAAAGARLAPRGVARRMRASGRIRIGYLSPNLGDHPVGHVTQGLFAAHDRDRFEVFGYAWVDRSVETAPYHRTIRDGCDVFRTFRERSADAARLIAADGIDLLVDLDGLMSFEAPEILSYRPSPIQVFWLGHAGVPPLPLYDYLIADAVVLPAHDRAAGGTAIADLPPSYHVASPHPIATACPGRAAYGLQADALVFGAFNNPQKIDSPTFDLWMGILRAVPGSQIWLSGGPAEMALRAEASLRGVDPARLIFAPREVDKAVHLKRHEHIDVFLDSLPLNASTTALDALWAGTPLLTAPGARFGSRIAASFLTALGLPELICRDPQDLAARAIALAGQPDARAGLRERVARAVRESQLFSPGAFARRLESAFQTMVDRHRGGLSPQGFEVAP